MKSKHVYEAITLEEQSDSLSRLTPGTCDRISFFPVTSLIRLGNKRTLKSNDLFDVPETAECEGVYTRFLPIWRDELRKKKSLGKALVKLCWKRWLLSYSLSIISQLLQLVVPYLIADLIDFFSSEPPEYNLENGNKPWYWGLIYVGIVLFCAIVSSLTSNFGHNLTNELSLWIRHCLQLLIYEKSLRMGSADIIDQGKCVNLLSTDTQIFMETLMMINSVLSVPILLIASAFLLYRAIGWLGLGSVLLTLCIIPLSVLITKQIAKNTRKVQAKTDFRVRLMNELVHGIRIIKYYAWERPFMGRIQKARDEELDVMLINGALRTGNLTLVISTPPFVLFVTFMTQVFLGIQLTPASVFTTFSVVNALRQPFNLIGYFANYVSQWQISLQRIRDFLLSGELSSKKTPMNAYPRGFPTVGSFSNNIPRPSTDFAATLYAFSDLKDSDDKSGKQPLVEKDKGKRKDDEHDDDDKTIIPMEVISQRPPRVSVDTLHQRQQGLSICMSAASFLWGDGETALADADLKVHEGELVMVIGSVGSGKSALINSLLGELFRVAGISKVVGSIAYVPQTPWILNQTLRDNVIFGLPFEEDWYSEVIRISGLESDLSQLPGGDLCEIGERGITLSGGQKQRVSIARAIYCKSEVILMDDPLSALDMHVSQYVFKECILGTLKSKTRLLVTNNLTFLDQANRILVLQDQEIRFNGTYEELLKSQIDLSRFVAQSPKTESSKEKESPERKSTTKRSRESRRSTSIRQIMLSNKSGKQSNHNLERGELTKKEEVEQGNVSNAIYRKYFQYGGVGFLLLMVFGYANRFSSRVLYSFCLSRWSTFAKTQQSSSISSSENEDSWTLFGLSGNNLYMIIQASLVIYEMFSIVCTSLTWIANGRHASKTIHNYLLQSLCSAPTWFYDKTPLGRIISRFSKDIRIVDSKLPNHMEMYMGSTTNLLAILTIVCLADWWMIFPFIPIGIFYFWMQHAYRKAIIEVRRLEGTSRSPIYIHFDNTLAGLTSIRAYRCAKRFRTEFASKINENGRILMSLFMCQQWFTQRLDWIGAICQCLVLLSLLAGRYFASMNAGLIALAVSNMSSITNTLSACSKNAAEAEQTMQSVERILQYCDLPKEEEPEVIKADAPENWPSQGVVSFNALSVKYRPELPVVLKEVRCQIEHGEKIGVVGRTGSGKSTLLAALFRIIEPCSGSITIDGINISELKLSSLRSKMAIIPQDPALFSGTVRYNLDPFEQYTDEEIWHALDLSHLREHIQGLEGRLSANVSENGDNFSVGQKQLICMSRAILRQSKIIMMDEATASIDVKTDMQIQAMIRTVFADCTIFTVAHRLLTIMDSSRVMVFDDGALAEFDTPIRLIQNNQNGIFASMVNSAKDELLLKIASHEITLEQYLKASIAPHPIQTPSPAPLK